MLTRKRLSGDLDRAYKMGLLRRKRVKRIIVPAKREPVVRGFEYEYEISRQGQQYLEFLARPRAGESRAPLKSFPDILDSIKSNIIAHQSGALPAEMIDDAFGDKPFAYRGRHRRFPSDKYWELRGELEQCKRELARKDAEIAMLRRGIIPSYALVKSSWSFGVPQWL